MSLDPSAQAFTAQGIYRRGVSCTFQRYTGVAPNATLAFSATVIASIETVIADTTGVAKTGLSARQPGSISQDDRLVIVMANDLALANFPFPPAKNDKILVVETGEKFNVIRVDPYKRAMAGAIELTMTGAS